MTPEEILAELDARRAGDLPTHGGHTLAYVYDSGSAEADALGKQALAMYASTNGLDPTAFPSLLSMERDLVAFARSILHGTESCVGTLTSGGTESILLAIQTARDAARARGVERPVMITPTTIHAAFAKGAHYFDVERIAVPVGPDHRADIAAMTEAIEAHGDRVALVAVSAPSYAHGVIDDVPAMAAVTGERGLRLHVDACVGGWILPWAPTPHDWDFAVDGVTSMSVDLHKYGYAQKGASLLLHASPDLRRPQYFAYADWPGYTMLNATMQSTKSGGPLAAAWATVRLIGAEGYADLVAKALSSTRQIADGIAAIEHLHVVEEPDATLIAIGTDTCVDIFTIADLMLDRGWFVQPQMAFGDEPPTLHLTISAANSGSEPEFLAALAEATAQAAVQGPIVIDPMLAEAAATLDPSTLDDEAFDALLALAGLASDDGQVAAPDRLGGVNALLNVAPPRVREALLIAFLDRLSR